MKKNKEQSNQLENIQSPPSPFFSAQGTFCFEGGLANVFNLYLEIE